MCIRDRSHKQFEPLEATVKVREVRFEVKQKGFRTKQVTLVTTLLDSKAYPASALGQLYRLRWQAEISLRHLKTRMQMEFLSSKTPDMARKEFYVHLLAYNLIRAVQKEAGQQHGSSPWELSFAATVQHVGIFVTLIVAMPLKRRADVYLLLLVLWPKRNCQNAPIGWNRG